MIIVKMCLQNEPRPQVVIGIGMPITETITNSGCSYQLATCCSAILDLSTVLLTPLFIFCLVFLGIHLLFLGVLLLLNSSLL